MRKFLQRAYQELADEFSASVLTGIGLLCFLVSYVFVVVVFVACVVGSVVGLVWSAFHSM